MSEELDDIVDNLKEPSSWIRLLFMVAFALVLYLVIAPVILVIMIVQALFTVLSGESNGNLRLFSAALSKYIYQMLEFLTYNSEQKPFPFSDFPDMENGEALTEQESASGAGKKKAAAKKPTRKKTAAKKTETKKAAPKKSSTAKPGSGNGADD